MRLALLAALVPLLAGCASRLADSSNEELVRDMVTIRAFDGHTGFGTPEGPLSYGWEAKQVLIERKAAGQGLTAPEFAVLLAYTKIAVYDDLLESDVPEDPYISRELEQYFPTALRERFRDRMVASLSDGEPAALHRSPREGAHCR